MLQITAIVLRLAAQSRKETGCVSYEILQEWTGVMALDAHNKTAHFHEPIGKSQPVLVKPLEVGRYETIG